PCINALAGVVNKLVSEHCSKNKITGDKARIENFIVDIGFNIGELRGRGKKEKATPTSLIKIEGFTGNRYHIFPVAESEPGIRINAENMLTKTIAATGPSF
ncbi:MAG TPA: hypothetical protein VHA13_02285, partial [Gammaproteobacteria bacterium]|nr:hypothetical protein [Gammaproteobacteria bacterium]